MNKKRIRSGYVVDLEIGSVCRIKVEGNTRAATDHPTIPVIVTSCRNSKSQLNSYTIASRDGHLAGLYARENLEYEPIMARLIRGGKLVAMLKSKELTHVQQIKSMAQEIMRYLQQVTMVRIL